MPYKTLTITMPEEYAQILQRIANEEQDGNKSAVVRELLLMKFDQRGIVPCDDCGKLYKHDDLIPHLGKMVCSYCAEKGD